jgi:hypothetical protein
VKTIHNPICILGQSSHDRLRQVACHLGQPRSIYQARQGRHITMSQDDQSGQAVCVHLTEGRTDFVAHGETWVTLSDMLYLLGAG